MKDLSFAIGASRQSWCFTLRFVKKSFIIKKLFDLLINFWIIIVIRNWSINRWDIWSTSFTVKAFTLNALKFWWLRKVQSKLAICIRFKTHVRESEKSFSICRCWDSAYFLFIFRLFFSSCNLYSYRLILMIFLFLCYGHYNIDLHVLFVLLCILTLYFFLGNMNNFIVIPSVIFFIVLAIKF